MRIVWLTTQFPNRPKIENGIFIFRTVKELSKYYDITVLVVYPLLPPIFSMLKNYKYMKKIYRNGKTNSPEILKSRKA